MRVRFGPLGGFSRSLILQRLDGVHLRGARGWYGAEDDAHEIHSNPQLYLGPLIQKKLAELPGGRPGGAAYTVGR